MPEIFPRRSRVLATDALADTRVVLLTGARQVGKSTLAKEIVRDGHPATFVNLDEQPARQAALADPEGFVAGLERPVLIDEVQRAGPDLFLAIKSIVDADGTPGQFFLTGSANVPRSRKVWEALTGRLETVQLQPLAQAEIERTEGNIVDDLFAAAVPGVSDAPKGRDALRDRLTAGGYPEARLRTGRRRTKWFESYVTTTLGSDVKDITDAYKLEQMPRLLRLLAAQAANLCVPANLSNGLSIHRNTVEHYIDLLEAVFLVRRLPAWTPGIGQREVHHPKVYVVDTGLLLHLLGADEKRLLEDPQVTGKALENFVAMEVLRHAEWSRASPEVFHYRRARDEVDLVLENRSGEVAAIEVKSSASISPKDWKALARLRDARGESFRCGALIYTGSETVPLGERLIALPLSAIWA